MNQSALTEQILEYWRTDDTFRKSLQERSAQRSFRFYDGPPFTSGDPHYGHLLQSTVKDMVPRWMTMRGYRVDRKRGWDCHGIPAENFVNKQLGITTKKQVEAEYGVGPYVEECRKMVNQVNDNWKWFVDHVGRWVDMDNAYFTMDNDFMESVIWVFSDLYSKNLIYKGFKVLGYSRALGTALSASEIAEGYEDRQDPAVTVRFRMRSSVQQISPNGVPSLSRGEQEHPLAENQEDIYERTADGALIYVLGIVTNVE
jgi:isoleucyl-tRNA synthetase